MPCVPPAAPRRPAVSACRADSRGSCRASKSPPVVQPRHVFAQPSHVFAQPRAVSPVFLDTHRALLQRGMLLFELVHLTEQLLVLCAEIASHSMHRLESCVLPPQ